MTGPHRYATPTDTAPTVDDDPTTWMTEAACAGHRTGTFFCDEREPSAVRAAVAICAACPVLERCRRYAVTAEIVDGIWGGLTVAQRQRMTRAQRRNAA